MILWYCSSIHSRLVYPDHCFTADITECTLHTHTHTTHTPHEHSFVHADRHTYTDARSRPTGHSACTHTHIPVYTYTYLGIRILDVLHIHYYVHSWVQQLILSVMGLLTLTLSLSLPSLPSPYLPLIWILYYKYTHQFHYGILYPILVACSYIVRAWHTVECCHCVPVGGPS